MSKDELIEFLKESIELDVSYGDDKRLDIILLVCGEVVDTVEIDYEG